MPRRRPRKPSILTAAVDVIVAVAAALTRVGRTAAITVLHD